MQLKILIRRILRCKSNQNYRENLLSLGRKTSQTLRRTCIYLFLPLLLFLLLMVRCANMVSPEGGPKDMTPPTVTGCDPPNYSVHFEGRTIRIDFDEFVNAETSGDKVLVSPPLTEPPDYRLRGKSLVVAFEDTLMQGTTYTVNFGSVISDITEGNKISGFTYAFSTGAYLDSLTLTGKVTDGFTSQPVKDILVMLYVPDNDTIPADSLPALVRPDYITRSKEDGSFAFTNIPPNSYKIIALADKTGDMLFNTVGEWVAYSDSLVTPWYDMPAVRDTSETNEAAADSAVKDTVSFRPVAGHMGVPLRLFEPKDSVQSLEKTMLVRDRMATMIFRFPPQNLRIVPLNADSLAEWSLIEPGTFGDTLTLWLLGSLPDTLNLKVEAQRMVNDTVDLPVKLAEAPKKGKKAAAEKPVRLDIKENTRGGLLNFFKGPLVLTASYPLDTVDLSGLRIIDGKDTLKPVAMELDSLNRRIMVRNKWAEGKPYQLFLPDSALFSVNGLTNDTLRIRFKTSEARMYGNLKVNLRLPPESGQVIIQLLTEKEKVVEEQVVKESGKISFDYLFPAKYKLKVIVDHNSNRRWDSGDYFRKIQPEKVIYFPRTLELRANWDVEETWEL